MKTCLVVDDSRVIRKVARKIIEELEFECVEAADGAQALEACRKQMPDAVLVNPHSPDDIAHAIQTALDMSLEERKARYQKMIATVRDDNVQDWTANFLRDLGEA